MNNYSRLPSEIGKTIISRGERRDFLKKADQASEAQAGCKKPDGSYKNNNHAMFIDWALKYALENSTRRGNPAWLPLFIINDRTAT